MSQCLHQPGPGLHRAVPGLGTSRSWAVGLGPMGCRLAALFLEAVKVKSITIIIILIFDITIVVTCIIIIIVIIIITIIIVVIIIIIVIIISIIIVVVITYYHCQYYNHHQHLTVAPTTIALALTMPLENFSPRIFWNSLE